MSGVTITSTGYGATLGAKVLAKAAATRAGLTELASTHAQRGEGDMKENASWIDRTSNARQGLTGRAEGLTITLMHTMDYGKYLENGTSRMRAYPIVQPTGREVATAYTADAAAFVKAIWG